MVAVNAGTTIRGVLATTAVARINVGFSALTNAAGKIVAIVSLSTCVANYVASNFGISMPIATFSEKCDGPLHRGRFQAQGGGVEESVDWSQRYPPSTRKGLYLLRILERKLTRADREARSVAFEMARQYIKRVGITGGVTAPVSKRWPHKNAHIRVDLEVILGRAFVPN